MLESKINKENVKYNENISIEKEDLNHLSFVYEHRRLLAELRRSVTAHAQTCHATHTHTSVDFLRREIKKKPPDSCRVRNH